MTRRSILTAQQAAKEPSYKLPLDKKRDSYAKRDENTVWVQTCGEEDEREQQYEVQGHTERPTHEPDNLNPALIENEARDQSSYRPNDATEANYLRCA